MFVVFCGVILFGWQYFFAPKHEAVTTPHSTSSQEVVKTSETTAVAQELPQTQNLPATGEEFVLVNETQKFWITSGLRFNNIENGQVPFTYRNTIGEGGYFQIFIKKDGQVVNANFTLKEKITEGHLVMVDTLLGITADLNLEQNGVLNYSFLINSFSISVKKCSGRRETFIFNAFLSLS